MNTNVRRRLKNKARYVYGLAEVLKCDIDILRKNIDNYDLDKSRESMRDIDETTEKLLLIIEEIRYIINLDETRRP